MDEIKKKQSLPPTDVGRKLLEQKQRFETILGKIDRDLVAQEIRELEVYTLKEGFWQNQDQAKKITKKLSDKQRELETLENLEKGIEDALQLITDVSIHEELEKEVGEIENDLSQLELKLFLSGPHDQSEAIISIHSGTGGVEAMDWAQMLVRMYQRYFDKKGWEYEVTDESLGEEAGIKTLSMIVHEPYSYGFLKGEGGTHRLVRQSPFNADHLRQTSFALVEVLPVIEGAKEVDISDDDLEFEAFRSSGAGGQNVNKVATAVRLKHQSSGIVVTCQTERSQLQNRENALKMLKAKLWILRLAQDKKLLKELKGGATQASWGTQIRSYVLHPYKLVKDLRTSVETSQAEAVLNGDLNLFIEAEVRSTSMI